MKILINQSGIALGKYSVDDMTLFYSLTIDIFNKYSIKLNKNIITQIIILSNLCELCYCTFIIVLHSKIFLFDINTEMTKKIIDKYYK